MGEAAAWPIGTGHQLPGHADGYDAHNLGPTRAEALDRCEHLVSSHYNGGVIDTFGKLAATYAVRRIRVRRLTDVHRQSERWAARCQRAAQDIKSTTSN